MVLNIPDEVMKSAGLTEEEARIGFACWLYDIGQLDLWPAAQMAGMSRVEFEDQLLTRGLPVYRISEEQLKADMAVFEQLGIGSHDRRK